jgi:energy-coupling factor transporter ATP-binding protein EcfA2
MSEPYQRPVARIWRDRGTVVGAGFLAPRGVVVTCAHVVNDALGREQLCRDEACGTVRIDLPWVAGKTAMQGSVVAWHPPIAPGIARPNPCVDIAVLQLDAEPPPDAVLKPQSPAAVPEDASFRVMGFPGGSDAGAQARGTVRASDADGWHLVEADRNYGRTLEPGFSGAPAIADAPGRRLLGMIDVTNPDERRGVLIPGEALMRAWPPLAEPYRGLEAFREEDAAYLFGRDALKDRLWRSFERNPITLLTGPSGSGKSSLLNAGLLPRLRRQGGWRVVRVRPGDRPVRQLARALADALGRGQDPISLAENAAKLHAALQDQPASLLDYADALERSAGERICLIVDQFEETFTLARPTQPAEHSAFLAALTCATRRNDNEAVKAVLGLRSDFQTNLQADREAAELVGALDGEPTILLRPLTPVELEGVIRGPLAESRLNVVLEDGLLSQLLSDLARNADALPLLEFALSQLWANIRIDRGTRSLSRSYYDSLGGIAGALAKHADAALDDLKIDDSSAKRLFVELVRVGASAEHDTRRPRSRAELDAVDEGLWSIAQRLADRRLLVTTDIPGIDIVHEALFRQWRRLADWIEQERDFLRWRQRLEERRREWELAGRHPDDLLPRTALDEAGRWLATHAAGVDQPQRDYVDTSAAAQAASLHQQQARGIWERLELRWSPGFIPDHELAALLDLAQAAPETKHEFLLSGLRSEALARRLGRLPEIAIRAALGLDLALVARFASSLVEFCRFPASLQYEQLWVSVSLGSAVADRQPEALPQLLVERAAEGIGGTTATGQLRAYGELVRAFAGHVDAGTGRTLVERAAEGIHRFRSEAAVNVLLDIALLAGAELGSDAVTYVWSELLKHPLSGRADSTRKLIAAIAGSLRLDLPSEPSLWQFLEAVAEADPLLPLAAPYSEPDKILAEFHRRLDSPATPHSLRSAPPRAGIPARTAPAGRG